MLVLLFACFAGCGDSSKEPAKGYYFYTIPEGDTLPSSFVFDDLSPFEDVLDLKGVPDSASDRYPYIFSDQGAWFGFAIPNKGNHNQYGGFSGPLLIGVNHGTWISKTLCQLTIFDVETNAYLDLSKATDFHSNSFPGYLSQYFTLGDLNINLNLIYVNESSALIRAEVSNVGQQERMLKLGWTGESFGKVVETMRPSSTGVNMDISGQDAYVNVRSTGDCDLAERMQAYIYSKREVDSIGNGLSAYNYAAITFAFDADTLEQKVDKTALLLDEDVFWEKYIQMQMRWMGYLKNAIKDDSELDKEHHLVAAKAVMTLLTNWRTAVGELKHDGIFPSYHQRWFHGFWAWDSWKHSAALARIHPELAKNQIRAMFDYQRDGMIVDCIFRDTAEEAHNWRNTKPPLAAWAVQAVSYANNDNAFTFEMLPQLLGYHYWWYENRDHNKNGLCEYGSTDGTRIAAAWESGMDNAVRFDSAKLVQINENAWSLDQESVDLNAFLYAEKIMLTRMVYLAGDRYTGDSLLKASMELEKKIREAFYDHETEWFYDRSTVDGHLIKEIGTEGWIPLWAKIIPNYTTDENEQSVLQRMTADENMFGTYVSFPTLIASHPKFDPADGYWRGPVWIDQVNFACEGLRNAGYYETADAQTLKVFQNAEGMLTNAPFRENYHPITGEGLNAEHFSWTAAHYLSMYWAYQSVVRAKAE